MTSTRIFGTDGIRGRAGEGWLTAANVSALGRTAGDVLGALAQTPKNGKRRALVGHDGRRSGPDLEAALARGLAKSGLEVASAGLITTPGLALLTRLHDFDLGAMVSASHNPAEDNGIKLFSSAGEKLSEQLELAIEARLHAGVEPVTNGAAAVVLDPELERAYLTNLIAKAGANLALEGMRIVLDCANGGGSRVAPRVFGRLGAQVTAINAEPDGDNINRGCGSTHPEALQEQVRRNGAQVGIALDGDGDRCILVDERGEIVHGDGVLTICARAAAARRAWTDPRIVATVMSNRGLHRALREVGIGVVTVDVGDRHVVEALRREKLQLGGEQSGHIVFGADNHFIGDGTYTALRVLRVLAASGKTLSELAAPYRAFPQVLINVAVGRKPNLAQIPKVVESVKLAEGELGEDGRVLLRYSGTEPLARVMVEGPDSAVIQRLAQSIAQVLSAEIGGP